MITNDVKEKLLKVKMLVMDVDGTLTDGAMYYSANGEELKRFNTRDGMGISLLHRAGIQTAILTTENTKIVEARAAKLKIDNVILGSRNKRLSLEVLLETTGFKSEEIAYIGDDVNDEPAIKMSGISACPGDAVEHIKGLVDYICKNPGGNGAVREFAELILKTQNQAVTLPEQW
jgi:YrbI family 3-deoxy-D-manno-octulosonate 8-phosphate phosphatase